MSQRHEARMQHDPELDLADDGDEVEPGDIALAFVIGFMALIMVLCTIFGYLVGGV